MVLLDDTESFVVFVVVTGNCRRSQLVLLKETTGLASSLNRGVTLGGAAVAFCGTGERKLLQILLLWLLPDGVGVSGKGENLLLLRALEVNFGVKDRTERID